MQSTLSFSHLHSFGHGGIGRRVVLSLRFRIDLDDSMAGELLGDGLLGDGLLGDGLLGDGLLGDELVGCALDSLIGTASCEALDASGFLISFRFGFSDDSCVV